MHEEKHDYAHRGNGMSDMSNLHPRASLAKVRKVEQETAADQNHSPEHGHPVPELLCHLLKL